MKFEAELTFMNPWAIGPITAMSPFFFRGRVLLWFSSNTMDSLSNCLARLTAFLLWISLSHWDLGAAGYGFSNSPISNLALSTLETAVSTVLISSLPALTSSGIFRKLLAYCQK
jgi:hypothetical protein